MAERGREDLPPQIPAGEAGEGGEGGEAGESGGGGVGGDGRHVEAAKHEPTPSKSAKKGKKKRKQKEASLPGATGGASKSGQPLTSKNLQDLLGKLSVEDKAKSHDFWDTQPVPRLDEKVTELGPLEANKDEIRSEPLKLPDKFIWSDVDLQDDAQIAELYTLLCENYVEDEDNMFRFDYSCEFLRWALLPPGWKQVWHCGVRVSGSRKLVGFISAVPAMIRIQHHQQQMVEINFLCVHKKLRSKRVAPVLIKEITRRVNLEGIFQAVYTAGVLIPKPMAVCRYWHRSLNPKKLVDVQFSALHRHMTLQRMIRLFRLPEVTKTPGLRVYEERDAPVVLRLLNKHMEKFDLVPLFQTEAEIDYWLKPRDKIINTYVVESPETHQVTDMISYYHLPSTVMRHPTHKILYVAYLFYYFTTTTSLRDLLYDILILAKQGGADVFNSLDVMDNKSVLEELKFGQGDGNLHYYFYNFKCPEVPPEKVGLVLQ